MPRLKPFPIIAVDIGNARIKLGAFDAPLGDALPEPTATLALDGRRPAWESIFRWLQGFPSGQVSWWIGSVNRPTTTRMLDWLRDIRPQNAVTLLAADDLPLQVDLPRPDMVGVDRLLDAVAANRLRTPDRPAVVVDVGTAITIDAVSADGVFQGGAILPGVAMAARALHEWTDLLPLSDLSELSEPPPAVGTDTRQAMRSGLFWGPVGAIRELVGRLSEGAAGKPDVFLTGGAGPAVARLLGKTTRHVPHLTLSGIAISAAAAS
jgi:type III pantothenate kinase